MNFVGCDLHKKTITMRVVNQARVPVTFVAACGSLEQCHSAGSRPHPGEPAARAQ